MSEVPVDPLFDFILERNPQNLLEMRQYFDELAFGQFNNGLPEIGESVDDVVIATVDGVDITVDVHVPKGEGPFPVVVFSHGGGWSTGSSKTHRKLGFRFAEAGLLVFNVNYRLVPEHPFPAGYDDCRLALDWVRENAKEYGGDVNRLALAGDSAGGLLAAAVAVHDEHATLPVKALALIYPALELESYPATIEATPDGIPNMTKWVFEGLFPEKYRDSLSDPRISPINAADKFPPTLLIYSPGDPSVIEGCEALPPKLEAADIPHEILVLDDLPHGFLQMEEIFPEVLKTIRQMTDFLLKRL